MVNNSVEAIHELAASSKYFGPKIELFVPPRLGGVTATIFSDQYHTYILRPLKRIYIFEEILFNV